MRKLLIVAAATLALLAVGCGSSKKKTSSTATTAPTATATTATTTSKKPAAHHPAPHPAARPHPASSGPPPAPDGLRAGTGYATYELCTSNCSGSVPASLRRPLRTPASCSPHSASGPVSPQPTSPLHVTPFVGSGWEGGRVAWQASGYSGPLLIRGRQIGGSGAVGFGEGHVPYDELQLKSGSAGPPWQSFTRVRSPGCFFYQVDGTSFSETIVFSAR